MIRFRNLTILAVSLLVTACASSPPVHFFTLAPMGTNNAPSPFKGVVQVAAVHIPATLDRQQMVRQSSTTRLKISDQHRWAAPLDQMVQRVLTQDLVQRLPQATVVLPGQSAPTDAVRVVVDILQFTTDAQGQVTFDGGWSQISSTANGKPRVRNHRLQLKLSSETGDYADQAQAMSQVLGRLADAMTVTLNGAH